MTVPSKGPVLRVTGLAASQSNDELVASLKAAINNNLTDEEKTKMVVKVVIVPSCYSDEEKVALVECPGGLPAFLSELAADPLSEWQVEMGDTDISFDQHFFGFTQLYTPAADAPVTADIVAITGLDGHAYGSWRGRGNLGRMWLRDFLCKDLPCCRTMIYGYNANLSSHGLDTILDYGRSLQEELNKVRGTEELRQRPLFFVAHSFGGIILAHCLIRAAQMTENRPAIAALHRATYGMFLFGIPHRGLVVDGIKRMLAGEDGHPRSELLEQIKEKSNQLASQLDSFRNIIQDRKVVSFYERRQTQQPQFDSESKRWKRTGDFVTAVDSDSALLQLPDSMEEKIPLNADHSMMVKFDTKDALGYRSVRDRLQQFVEEAPGVVADRFARAQNRPAPCNLVPFPQDHAFVGREDLLAGIQKIHTSSASPSHSRAALVGLGGVGKSQIAIEYAYRVSKAAPHMWVFWVHASNSNRFKQAYEDIAARVELPGRDKPEMDILRLLRNWLCDERNGRWLMIVDNADDDRVFASPDVTDNSGDAAQGPQPARKAAAPLASYLPQAAHGWILVTSRDTVAAMNLVGARHNVVHVEAMGEDDALALLKSKTAVDDEGDARALVEALGGIPLAVTHAAAYIEAYRPAITLSAYLQQFRESEANQASLLNQNDARDLRRDDSASSAIITTWQLSFEQIRQTRPEAADLLSLMTMFDRQGIPGSILYEGRSKLQFSEAVNPLLRFSLVRAQVTKQSETQLQEQLFEMHSLVQLATREWVKLHGQTDAWQRAALRIMAATFPNGEHETWTACRALLPHSTKVLGYSTGEDNEARLDQAAIMSKMAWYLLQMGQYAEAERYGCRAVAAREEVLGGEHPQTLISVSILGLVLSMQGKYKEAEAMHQRVLEGYEKVLGREHPDTLVSVSNLGLVLEKQGKYKEAEAMHRQALEGSEKVLGREHPDTLTSVSNLGLVLSRQGKYKEAEAMYRRDLAGSEKVLGREHPDMLASVSNLGSVLSRQGKHKEAEVMHQQALEGLEKVLGREHPDTLTSVSELGSVLWNQQRFAEAETLDIRVLEVRKRVLGEDHPDTLLTLNNLAVKLRSQGRREEALSLMEACIEAQGRVLGLSHPHTKLCTATLMEWRSENADLEASVE